jgi:uncharacterized cupin superfamily protein
MHLVRIEDAPAYEAPGHEAMAMKRLQGREAGPAETAWIGLSRIAPGGGTTLDASDYEKFYVGIEGETTLSNGTDTVVLRVNDTCRVAPGEGRQLSNATDRDAVVLLVMALQPSKAG